MKHILLTRIDEETGDLCDLIVDGSKIICATDILASNSVNFDHCLLTLDSTYESGAIAMMVAEPTVEVLKRIDECDRLNKR